MITVWWGVVFAGLHRTFTKLNSTSHKETVNKEKNVKFVF